MPKRIADADALDRSFVKGQRTAFARLLQICAGELGADTSEGKLAALLAERERTVSALRKLCAAYGSNAWPDNAYMPDVVEKRLGRHLADPDDVDAEEESAPANACESSPHEPLTDAMLDDIEQGRVGCRCALLLAEVRRMRTELELRAAEDFDEWCRSEEREP